MANIVEIIIKGIDQATKPLSAPVKSLSDLQGVVTKLGPIVAATTAALGAAFTGLTAQAINAADETGKLAQKAGVGTEAFSELAVAGKLSEVSGEQLAKALKNLNLEIVNVASGTAGAEHALNQLGIQVKNTDGTLRSADQVFKDVAEALSNIREPAVQAALAEELFKRQAQELIPLLNEGRDGIERAEAMARRFGLTVTQDAAEAADTFNDNLAILRLQFQGFFNQVATQVLPVLSRLSTQFVETANDSLDAADSARSVANVFRVLATVAFAVANAFNVIADIIAGAALQTWDQLGALVTLVTRTFDNYKQSVVLTGRALMDLIQAAGGVGDVFSKLVRGDFQGALDAAKGTVGEMGDAFKDLGSIVADTFKNQFNNVADYFKTVTKGFVENGKVTWDAIQKDLDTFAGRMVSLWDDALTKTAKLSKDKKLTPEIDTKAVEASQEMFNRVAMQAYELQRQIEEDSLTGQERQRLQLEHAFQDRLAKIAQLGLEEDAAIALSNKAYAAHQVALTELEKKGAAQRRAIHIEHVNQVATLFGNLANLAKAFGKKGFVAYKALATAEAIISTAAGVARALKDYAWPYNLIVGAAVAAAGAAQIATIHSTQPSGQAHGGIDFTPTTGTYVLEQGERVIKTRQNEDLTEFLEGGRMMQVIVNLDGRPIIDEVAQASRDGRLEINARSVVSH